MKKINLILTTIFAAVLLVSCSKDNLEPTLADTLPPGVYSLEDYRQYVDGSYRIMADYRYWGRNVIITGEVRADNVFANLNSGRFTLIGQMNYNPQTADVSEMMQYIYGTLATANIVINSTPEDLTTDADELAEMRHIMGEAYAIRALAHFDLVRLFGQQHVSGQGGMNSLGVSYVKEFKGEERLIPRSTVAENLQDIYADLNQAQSLMSTSFNDNSKLRITTHAVNAIKSRVATYFKDYETARTASEAVISNFNIVPAAQLVQSWASQTPASNSIFELAQLPGENNGINGIANIYRGPSYGDIQVIEAFPADAEFGPNDVRNSPAMIGYDSFNRLRNLGKYPTMGSFTDNIRVFRIEEIVLNYAEALLDVNPALALTHLNSIPLNRDGTTYAVANIDNILKERRKELAFEGFRFDDMARHGRDIRVIDANVQNHGGPTYGSFNYALPIPQREINANTNSTQNFGY